MIESIVILAEADFAALARVRTLPGLRAARADGEIWLRGIPLGEQTPVEVRKLPIQRRYTLDAADRLFPAGGLTPTGMLPDLAWQRIREFFPVEAPVSAMPGQVASQVAVHLVRSDQPHPGDALLTDLRTWKDFAETAAAVRLKALRFAVSDAGQVLILGTPLPPLPGQEFRHVGQLLLPSGYDFAAAAMGALLQEKLNPLQDSLLLFHADAKWERIPWRAFVPATRSAIRLSPVHTSHPPS